MILLHAFKGNICKTRANIFKQCSVFIHQNTDDSKEILKNALNARNEDDLPVEMNDPFAPEKPKCILCKYDIEPNFRNVRLLSQFVSSFTGRIYGRHITGLCEYKHKMVEREIKKAQTSGLMGAYVKDPKFLTDPDLYDPLQPLRII